MNLRIKQGPPWPGSAYQKRQTITYCNPQGFYVNPYISHLEKSRLAKMLAYGETIYFVYPFVDPRHQIIYSWLKGFLYTFPRDQYDAEWFIVYLSTTPGIIEKAGGAAYIQSIFQGIGGGDV